MRLVGGWKSPEDDDDEGTGAGVEDAFDVEVDGIAGVAAGGATCTILGFRDRVLCTRSRIGKLEGCVVLKI